MFSTLNFLTFTFWTFRQIQNAKASTIFKLSSWNFFFILHKVWWTKLVISLHFFIFYVLFKLKNNFPSTDTRKIENYVLSKNINFFLSSQNKFLKYGYVVFSKWIWDIVKKISRSYTSKLSKEIDFENRPFFKKEKKS